MAKTSLAPGVLIEIQQLWERAVTQAVDAALDGVHGHNRKKNSPHFATKSAGKVTEWNQRKIDLTWPRRSKNMPKFQRVERITIPKAIST